MVLAALFTVVVLILIFLIGLAMYAYYETCDPLDYGLVEEKDQVNIS